MYSQLVLASYLWVLKNEVEDLSDLRTELTVIPKFDKPPVPLYKERGGWFGIPMCYYKKPELLSKIVHDKRAKGTEVGLSVTSSFREGQEAVVDRFKSLVRGGNTCFIMKAPPGFGKTFSAICMMSVLNTTTLVVVPRSNLLHQWIDRLIEHSNLTRGEIGTAEDGKADWKGKKVVVGLVHTLGLDRFGSDFRSYFGVVIYDEVDRAIPPTTFAPVAGMFHAKYRIGVSATLKRQDGLEAVFEAHLGQCFITGKDANRMAPKVMIHYFPDDSGPLFGSDNLARRGQLISKLANNQKRNALLARYVRFILNSDRRVCVLSDRIEQLLKIKAIMISNSWVKESDVGLYIKSVPIPKEERTGKSKTRIISKKEREHTAAYSKVILGTYGMFALGTDIKDLAGLVYATPMSETKQSKGRIERVMERKKQPVVIDIVDTAYPMTMRWGKSREKEYLNEGLLIKRVRGKQ